MTNAEMLEELWHEYHQRILNYVRLKTRSDEFEDLTQIIFLRAWRAMLNGNGAREHVSGWIWRIANNVIVDYYRLGGREPERLEIDALADGEDEVNGRTNEHFLASSDPSPHEIAERNHVVKRVRWAVERMPSANQIDAMHLKLDGYDNDEICEMMGMSIGAVRAVHTRSRRHMRDLLQDIA